ncbi:OstA-like protein [Rhodonellum sp.]|uniref:OstA-like protein n=1 Tax=Rhodonellum sp. TaxID=2231180 RepID=UPI002724BB6E|nr:OstA-like protein [Rhodonellum sp.]MDO9551722.1 OstA-like protein [Rhodonellum sp.]
MIKNTLILLFILLSYSPQGLFAQAGNMLEIQQAEVLLGARGFERLIGDVKMKHQNSLIYCDSAHFYRAENMAKLFGNVRIIDQKDPVTTTSRYAEYDGNTRVAKLRNKVVFKNESTTLYTDFLDYNRATGIANYFNDGKVVDSTNVLTSENGEYETALEKITFTDKVDLVNPDYTLKTDFLIYRTIPKTAETVSITNIISKDGNKLNAQKGSFYDTENKIFTFYEGDAESETSRVSAETLYYDEGKNYYEGKVNVSVYNKEREVEIFGEEGKYWEERKYSEVYGNALVRKYFESDTLYMIADTLISQDHELAEQRHLLAFNKVQLMKADLYGVADSMAYIYADSTIHLYQDPVLWNNKSQITADSIHFVIANENIETAFLKQKAFVITKDTLNNFNQIKGRRMTGNFLDGKMSKLDVEGNGESLYFDLLNDSTLRGVNKLLCARILMYFTDGNISKINHLIKPEGSFTPPHIMKEELKKLEGFVWREEEKPTMEIINAWRKPKERDPDRFDFFNEPNVVIPAPTDEEIQKALLEKQKK